MSAANEAPPLTAEHLSNPETMRKFTEHITPEQREAVRGHYENVVSTLKEFIPELNDNQSINPILKLLLRRYLLVEGHPISRTTTAFVKSIPTFKLKALTHKQQARLLAVRRKLRSGRIKMWTEIWQKLDHAQAE